MAEDTAIEVVLKRSGLTFIVPPDKSILQVLIEEGIDPLYDCQRGECGICQVTVLDPNDSKGSFWQAPIMIVP